MRRAHARLFSLELIIKEQPSWFYWDCFDDARNDNIGFEP